MNYISTLSLLSIAFALQACNPQVRSQNTDTPALQMDTAPDTTTITSSSDDEKRIQNDSLARVSKAFPFMANFPFENYTAPSFLGTPAEPDFSSNPYASDPEYVAFIKEGCKRGINFGGHYTLIENSCGAMCEHLFMVDRKTGKILDTAGLKTEDGYYGFSYRKDSNLLIANATVLLDASMDEPNEFSIQPQIFKWKDNQFIRLK